MNRECIVNTIGKYGRAQEHLMLILRDLEMLSGMNVLDIPTLETVAEMMNLPRSAVAGFLDFYTMFSTRPRATFIIRVCKSGPCHVMGATTVFAHLTRLLGVDVGQPTKDGLFYIEKCECLGVCSVAPAMMINYDIHGHLTAERIAEILESYRHKKPLIHEKCGEEVAGINCIIDDPRQTKRLIEKIGLVNPLHIDSYIEQGGYRALKKALTLEPAEVINEVKSAGLRGRGGAGFPAGMKWSFVGKGPMQKYVICNADEGEPGTFKDRIIIEENPHLLIEGVAICGYAIAASLGIIYVRGEYRRCIERLHQAIEQAREKGILGNSVFGTAFNFDIIIKEGGGAYVCGEETSLINSAEGKRGYPRFRPPFPGGAGFHQLPSNVNNVETLMSVPMIVERGADWYKEVGLSTCTGTKLFCLSGKLKRTGLVELPMGTTLREIINTYGQGMREGSSFTFAQVGGSSGGIIGPDLLDLPLDIDNPLKHGLTLGSGVVLVCDQQTCPVDFLLQILCFFEHESCGQCVPCRIGTSHLHAIIKRFAERRARVSDIDLMVKKATLMKKTTLCALGQSPLAPLSTILKYFLEDFIRHCDPTYVCPACDCSLETYYRTQNHCDETVRDCRIE